MNPSANPLPMLLLAAAAALLLALLLLGLAVLLRRRARQRSSEHLERAVALRRQDASDLLDDTDLSTLGAPPPQLAFLQPLFTLLDQSLGRALVAQEDRSLLDQAGFHARHHRGLYLIARLLCLGLFTLAAMVLLPRPDDPLRVLLLWLGGLVLGLMLPKIMLRSLAARRMKQAHEETPLLIDLLKLLQGTGISLDQTLQIIASDFGHVLPVLGEELESANRQFAAGRNRADTLRRLARVYQSEDLANLVTLLGQIDRHGGAVQEPLRQFGERIREKRRAALREQVGRLNVKMTGVMVITLLPALLIVVAGPGFLAIVRSLARI